MKQIMPSLFVTIFVLISSLPIWAQGGRKAWTSQPQKSVEVVTLKGEILNVLKPLASFKSENGREYKVHLGPVWYWNQEKYELRKGLVEIVGEIEETEGEWHVYPNKMIQGKVEIILAAENGEPKWMGTRTRRSGKGHGRSGNSRCGRCGGCRK